MQMAARECFDDNDIHLLTYDIDAATKWEYDKESNMAL